MMRTVLSCDRLRNTVLKLLSFFLAHSERKRLRKPSKRLLEYAEEYDHLFAPKKKSKKGQEQLQKVGEGQCALCGYYSGALVSICLCSWWLNVLAVCSAMQDECFHQHISPCQVNSVARSEFEGGVPAQCSPDRDTQRGPNSLVSTPSSTKESPPVIEAECSFSELGSHSTDPPNQVPGGSSDFPEVVLSSSDVSEVSASPDAEEGFLKSGKWEVV